MTLIIALAALLVSCIVLIAFLTEVIHLIWRPVLGIIVAAVILWIGIKGMLMFHTMPAIPESVVLAGSLATIATWIFFEVKGRLG